MPPPEAQPAKPADIAKARRAASQAMLLAQEQRWIHVRLFGWLLIGVWQILSLVSEFWPVIDVESRAIRITGKLIGIVGLVLIAYGFERLVEIAHERADMG